MREREEHSFNQIGLALYKAFKRRSEQGASLSSRLEKLPFKARSSISRGVVDTPCWSKMVFTSQFTSALTHCLICEEIFDFIKTEISIEQNKRDNFQNFSAWNLLHSHRRMAVFDVFNIKKMLFVIDCRNDDAIKEFDRIFPDIVEARDALAHEHDRNYAYYHDSPISGVDSGQMISGSARHHRFMKPTGAEGSIELSTDSLDELVLSLENLCK